MILSFSDALVAPIQARTKVHTFRAGSRWRCGGMLIHFYARTRTPAMYRFFPTRRVVSVQAAELTAQGLHIEGRRLEGAELELFARHDGFATAAAFFAFFAARPLPLTGQLIHWSRVRYESGVTLRENEQRAADFFASAAADEDVDAQADSDKRNRATARR